MAYLLVTVGPDCPWLAAGTGSVWQVCGTAPTPQVGLPPQRRVRDRIGNLPIEGLAQVGASMAAMANSLGMVHEDRFPLTVTVYLETDGREIHRETIKTGGVLDLSPVAAMLDEQFPGKKALRVVDRDGTVVMKAGRLPTD